MKQENCSLTVKSSEEIQQWLLEHIAEELDIDKDEIDIHASFDRLGLDSAIIVSMIGELEDSLGFDISPTLPYNFPRLDSLSKELFRLSQSQKNKKL